MSPETPADPDRLALLLSGDSAAFEELVGGMQRTLFAYAWRYLQNRADAEDLVVETFIRLHQNAARLRPDTNVKAWLFTTLGNLCHNRHRWRNRHREVSLDGPAGTESNEPRAPSEAPDEVLEKRETMVALRDAIDRLPHDQRTAVLLHHYENMSYREIGAIVGCSERGVETRLYRARQALRVALSNQLRDRIAS